MKLLIVDDDPKVRSFLSRGLAESGLASDAAADATEAMAAMRDGAGYDLVLLDVMMPETSGWDLLTELRRSGDRTPVIFITARHQIEERVRGLELGADDYVIKPFELPELIARIQAVVRRGRELPVLVEGDLRVDVGRRAVERGDARIDVSAREFELLRELIEHRGEVRSKRELLASVWGLDFDPGTNVVEVAVARLRGRIDRGRTPLIHTVIGGGYCLSATPPAEARS